MTQIKTRKKFQTWVKSVKSKQSVTISYAAKMRALYSKQNFFRDKNMRISKSSSSTQNSDLAFCTENWLEEWSFIWGFHKWRESLTCNSWQQIRHQGEQVQELVLFQIYEAWHFHGNYSRPAWLHHEHLPLRTPPNSPPFSQSPNYHSRLWKLEGFQSRNSSPVDKYHNESLYFFWKMMKRSIFNSRKWVIGIISSDSDFPSKKWCLAVEKCSGKQRFWALALLFKNSRSIGGLVDKTLSRFEFSSSRSHKSVNEVIIRKQTRTQKHVYFNNHA